ncbi:ATP-binding protein [Variovorax saccharolyticus]|uniref:ATP-binding protein n=1 Tax=Variovorax saccharolyticus TaxID=3053516 RepID=UPI002578EA04|nr:ATP-binding protein [Variovorax sp. J22R187]MDM0018324.1 response regulator [Variovorax sp. J22R187]
MLFGFPSHEAMHGALDYGVIAALIASLALVVHWNRRLARELQRRRAVKAELRDQLAFQSAMIDGIPHAICVRDAQGRLTFCNVAFEKLFGTTRDAVTGTTVVESGLGYVDPLLMGRLHRRYLDLLANRGTISEEADISLHGERRRVLHWATPIALKEGEAPRGMVAGAIDITERHQLTGQIEAALGKAEEANRAKSNFLATMSHEIRTPMNAVMGMLELLMREGRLSARDRESVDLARNSAASLLGLIDDILDISKIEAGGLEIVLAPARLRPILDETARMFAGMARQRGLALTLQIDPDVGEWHVVDATRFKQIAGNLVSNAIKYTDAGSVTLRLRHLHRAGDIESIALEIEDTGIGIAPADVANLFRPFFQAEAAGPRAVGGTGLGLPIVQRLCLKMGGKIEVASQPGQGTCVRVVFELGASPPPAGAANHDTGADLPPKRHWQGRGTVLAVDDHPANRLLLQRQLQYLGLECELAEDGETALELWREGSFDLVITDCSMPGMDGYALVAAIRKLERERSLPRRPVLGCTAHVQDEERRLAIEAGMDECLMKPFSLDALSEALHRHLGEASALPLQQPPAPTPAPVQPSFENVFDPLALRALSDGDAVIETRFLEALLRTNLSDAQEIAQHIGTGAGAEAASIAHKIKGAARMVNARRVIQACEAIEFAFSGEGREAPAADFVALADALDEFNAAIRAELVELAASGTR